MPFKMLNNSCILQAKRRERTGKSGDDKINIAMKMNNTKICTLFHAVILFFYYSQYAF